MGFNWREDGLKKSAGLSDGCCPAGQATFARGTQSSLRTRAAFTFTSAFTGSSLGQAGTLTTQLC